MRELAITETESGGRLNKYLQKYLSEASSGFIYKMLRKKNIILNGVKADGSEILATGDVIKLFLSDETITKFSKSEQTPHAKPIKTVALSIVYEDAQVIMVNKPLNKLSQPDGRSKDSLIYDLHAYLKTPHNATFKPAIANRLDRNTTGLVLCGKNLKSLQALNQMIHDRQVDKYYVAIVHGRLTTKNVLKNYHEKDETKNRVNISSYPKPGYVEVVTEYEPLKIFDQYTYVKLQLITGKSHQLRAHMASIGHPIVGDTKYTGNRGSAQTIAKKYSIHSQLLHAHTIHIKCCAAPIDHLQGRSFTAELPKKFTIFLKSLEAQ